ncbi:MAG: thioesterase [Flavobacteriia bacterium]|nr:thioesterase [Flavobacteriia bacterium]OIP48561.1 MAG: thioesterase [Flavobacteriaceae bacterium CG2_30_31_66]PIV97069.1 MAG: thioesterase [Flavobacteriaceae bacterium CG17_big_fil_post_rev_8_21_14_2_50_31_13]PIX13860.1 MAG: thioesterase [Flavobacteriaceae bacterium CG_4_8_14_3_um_filter_31_8]PIY13694.1 MAG: thioesterase [Flavobacteriaceae bacterium CG_4_10_14_3_um_filter_31_253]PIZ10812.1 MAG: thioesterase [Flavobacteriaceae bacterium CG_4_10_14_0_8_um_filter_31_99]PJC10408.1 MAG: thioest
MSFQVTFSTKWADFDPNKHMRHTAYNDYAAEVRVRFFKKNNFTMDDFNRLNLGPILFSEETYFKKEILMGEDITVNLKLAGLSKNNERWKFTHEVFNEAGKLSATIKVYGAWIDLTKRKLTIPPIETSNLFTDIEKSVDFEEILVK